MTFQEGQIPWNKGLHKRLNTGKTHFPKGHIPWIKGRRIILKKRCEVCDILFEKPYGFNIGRWKKVKFCSLRCTGKAHTGEFAPGWRGGTTTENQRLRTSMRYQKWRLSVSERDGYKCVLCGSQRNLVADHIKRFSLYPSLRFDITNGRTLCKECHDHTKNYGPVRKEERNGSNYIYG